MDNRQLEATWERVFSTPAGSAEREKAIAGLTPAEQKQLFLYDRAKSKGQDTATESGSDTDYQYQHFKKDMKSNTQAVVNLKREAPDKYATFSARYKQEQAESHRSREERLKAFM